MSLDDLFSDVSELNKKRGLWKFDRCTRIENVAFDRNLEVFFEHGLDGLVRENIQNSLDAGLGSGPVKVYINLGDFDTENIPGYDEISERILSLEAGNDASRRTVLSMQRCIKSPKTHRYISFEDRNTKGLTDESWECYAYQKGAHHSEQNSNEEDSRGGSHGIGKIASNAASEIFMMFFSNCDVEGSKKIGGSIQLIDHKYKGVEYRASGPLTDKNEAGELVPYNQNYKLDSLLKKETRGLKIVIPFLREEYDDTQGIIKAVCNNFFVAVLSDKLEVFINNKLKINSENILDIVSAEDYCSEKDVISSMTKYFIKTYLEEKPEILEIEDKKDETYRFNLYFTYREDSGLKRGFTSIFRTLGMKIEDHKVTNRATKPYSAVLLTSGQKEDRFLKSLEDISHCTISAQSIKDKEQKSNATRFLSNLNKALQAYIDDVIAKNNPTDGKINTKGMFYVFNSFIKKLSSDTTSSVSVTPSSGRSSKNLLIKKGKNKTVGAHALSSTNKQPNDNLRNRDKRGSETQKDVYNIDMRPNKVKRIVVENEEILLLNISDEPGYHGETECNVHIKPIDGRGKPDEDEFLLEDFYDMSGDMAGGRKLRFIKNKILGISIKNGIIKLKNQLCTGANKSLKFAYVVEVLK